MSGARVLSSFLVTLAVLALIVGFSLHRDEVRAQAPLPQTTTKVAYHPVARLADQEQATVYVVNVGNDPDAEAERFTILFEDVHGNLLQPGQPCAVTAHQTCSATFVCSADHENSRGACVVRATVVGEAMGCVAADLGSGQWTTNLEIDSSTYQNRMILGNHGDVLQLPTGTCVPGVDSGSVDSPSIDSTISPDSAVPPPDSPISPDAVPPSTGAHY
jgi:hypothetical protein